MYKRNSPNQHFGIEGIDSTTGAPATGVSWTVRRCIDGTFASATGTTTEDGSTGGYKYVMSEDDINGENITFYFTATGIVPCAVNVITTPKHWQS